MPIVIESVSLESYLLWLSSQNSPPSNPNPFISRLNFAPRVTSFSTLVLDCPKARATLGNPPCIPGLIQAKHHYSTISPLNFKDKLPKGPWSWTVPGLKEILVGLCLGDLYIRRDKPTHNAQLVFRQGVHNLGYLYHLFDLFKEYCISPPKTENLFDKRVTKSYTSTYFRTSCLPCFNEYRLLFYPEGRKIIPSNIGDLLTPLGLAYLALLGVPPEGWSWTVPRPGLGLRRRFFLT